jgi:hypothetical protein
MKISREAQYQCILTPLDISTLSFEYVLPFYLSISFTCHLSHFYARIFLHFKLLSISPLQLASADISTISDYTIHLSLVSTGLTYGRYESQDNDAKTIMTSEGHLFPPPPAEGVFSNI